VVPEEVEGVAARSVGLVCSAPVGMQAHTAYVWGVAMGVWLPLIVVIVTAVIFDFTNGFHDTANAMATSIATGALRPKIAVGLSGVLNLVGAFLSVQVAQTISSGIVNESRISPAIIFGGLVGAILWNLVTWLLGLPSSSSHALIGGLIGATWIASGASARCTSKASSRRCYCPRWHHRSSRVWWP
jgi:phosphate/sulfate permease